MGYNSLLFIANDAIHKIDDDPKGFWDAARSAHHAAMDLRPDIERDKSKLREREFIFANHSGAFEWVWNNHADNTGLIMVGKNMPVVVGTAYYHKPHHTVEGQVEVLKQVADRLGYRLSKKPERR